MAEEYRQLLDGYLQVVPSEAAVPLMVAFCSSVELMAPFLHLRLTQLSDPGHLWSVRIPSSLVLMVIDQHEVVNAIGFQAKVDQLA